MHHIWNKEETKEEEHFRNRKKTRWKRRERCQSELKYLPHSDEKKENATRIGTKKRWLHEADVNSVIRRVFQRSFFFLVSLSLSILRILLIWLPFLLFFFFPRRLCEGYAKLFVGDQIQPSFYFFCFSSISTPPIPLRTSTQKWKVFRGKRKKVHVGLNAPSMRILMSKFFAFCAPYAYACEQVRGVITRQNTPKM